MMLLKRFIKAPLICMTRKSLWLSFFALIQGCSNTQVAESQNDNITELESDSAALVELVDTTNGAQASIESSLQTSSATSQVNAYEAEAKQKLANVPASVLEQYQQAIALMKQQEWQQADAMFSVIINAEPQLSGAYVNQAIIALKQNQLDKANGHLANAISANPTNPYAHQIKANIAKTQGKFEQAEQGYLTALEIWPNYPEAQVNLAVLLELYRGKLLDARHYYQSYLRLKPDDQLAQRWLAGLEIKIQRAGLTLPEGES
ncbi:MULTISPECIES: tetratricopeptide repeat protein [Shewanella]|uniref:tetratricopeptide repeat protein n=1 Tax=Shewanella TaxID=22 RepID=UPI0024953A60|nr:tetratricopeptide repeat protein [Shewanella japonica]